MIKDEYKKERRRVQRLISNYKRKGYDVDLNIPKFVKNPTQSSIDKLKAITPNTVRKKAYAPDFSTGEVINYYQFKIRYPKANLVEILTSLETGSVYAGDINILYFERIVSNYPDKVEQMVLHKLAGIIEIFGKKLVDEALSEMIGSGEIVEPSDGYNYRLVSAMMDELYSLLRIKELEKKEIQRAFLDELDSQEYYEGEFENW